MTDPLCACGHPRSEHGPMGNHPIWKAVCFHGRSDPTQLVPFGQELCRCMDFTGKKVVAR